MAEAIVQQAEGKVVDNGDGWYNVTYVVETAGPFTVLLGLDGVYSTGGFPGFQLMAGRDTAHADAEPPGGPSPAAGRKRGPLQICKYIGLR